MQKKNVKGMTHIEFVHVVGKAVQLLLEDIKIDAFVSSQPKILNKNDFNKIYNLAK